MLSISFENEEYADMLDNTTTPVFDVGLKAVHDR